MLHSRLASLYLALASTSLAVAACMMANPSWDPPVAGQTEGGLDDGTAHTDSADGIGSGPTTGSFEGDGDVGDEGRSDGDGDGEGEPGGDGEGEPGGDGEGEPGGDDDGNVDGGGGDEGGDDGRGGEDGPGGEPLVCGATAASFGPCPAMCDECIDGVCLRRCSADGCHGGFFVCPVSWSCHFTCDGKNSCRKATFICTGWGRCELDCLGDNACTDADILCAGGPCQVNCGAGHKTPCEKLDVMCGSNSTRLDCAEPYEGAGPKLSKLRASKCKCATNCKPR